MWHPGGVDHRFTTFQCGADRITIEHIAISGFDLVARQALQVVELARLAHKHPRSVTRLDELVDHPRPEGSLSPPSPVLSCRSRFEVDGVTLDHKRHGLAIFADGRFELAARIEP